jgi:alpha-1,2-mannosyltransferase
VSFEVNASFETLQRYLSQATIGVHTMVNEHFGIGVIEYMASGLIPVANRSGGPLMDIIVDWNEHPVGFLADTAASYAACFAKIFRMSEHDRCQMQESARQAAVSRFSDTRFVNGFLHVVEPVIESWVRSRS